VPASDSINATHPLYDCMYRKWQRCRDCWDGQDAVKSRSGGRAYLPPTEGMLLDGAFGPGHMSPDCIGQNNYNAYLDRALFYGFYADGVQMALGLAWTKEPIFEGIEGTPLEYLLTNATNEGEGLARLLYRINEAQIGIGRIGLLADMPAGETAGNPQPYITVYGAEKILNWDSGRLGELNQESLNLVVLNESGPVRTGVFEYNEQERYRVLALGPLETNEAVGVYRQGVFEDILDGGRSSGTPLFVDSLMFAPTVQGKTLDEIPFVFINSNNATSAPVDPPLLSLADIALALYKTGADYAQELHASTQATLVVKGVTDDKKKAPFRIGAGGLINLGSTEGAEAYFLELEGKGLPSLEKAVNDFKQLASQRAGEVIDQSSRGRESGSAMEQRVSVRTASLHAIVQSGACGLERLLKIIGKWLGMSEDQLKAVKIRPNLVFAKPLLDPVALKVLSEVKLMGGAVLPYKLIHEFLVNRGITTLGYEEVLKMIDEEEEIAKKIKPPPEQDPTKMGGSNGGPAITPASSGV
jgi:hypothetical protein